MTTDSPNQTLLPCREACAAPPISEIPLKGYYDGKPKRISIEYDDYSSQHIGNADGSVDLIFAKLEQLYSTRTPDNSIEARETQLYNAACDLIGSWYAWKQSTQGTDEAYYKLAKYAYPNWVKLEAAINAIKDKALSEEDTCKN